MEITISAAAQITAISEVPRRAFEKFMLEGLAVVNVPDAVTDPDVKPVKVAADEEDMKFDRDATANVLTIIVAKKVKPEGVMVIWSARTPAKLGATE